MHSNVELLALCQKLQAKDMQHSEPEPAEMIRKRFDRTGRMTTLKEYFDENHRRIEPLLAMPARACTTRVTAVCCP